MGFGDFSTICVKTSIPLCALVGHQQINGGTGIQASCYSRTIEIANTLIFQAANDFMHILALVMTVVMIIHVRSKFTAVGTSCRADRGPALLFLSTSLESVAITYTLIGRKEITSFFYIYMALTIVSLVLDAGVTPPGSATYPYFAAAQNGLTSALCTCLLINGFVGFQLYEDGTTLSVWLLRLCSIAMFIIGGAVSLLTFKSWAGLSSDNPVGIFVVTYIVNAIMLFVYTASQVLLVLGTLEDRWPMGDIIFGVFFFVIGQVILYVFSGTICDSVQHYVDGLFFATICNLLAVMMVYKVRLRYSLSMRTMLMQEQYWDSITREDLEFSVGVKAHNWEVKELIPEDDKRGTLYNESEYAPSMYQQPYGRASHYSVGH
jgi:hypothetical protein